ncbi:hypothetical protein KAR91_83775 [Candidatus Pacearchaeota archaeon]|nr:hypothetical protein [Candidatus Pacearchaeota archaeon]
MEVHRRNFQYPEGYWEMTEAERDKNSNGCGTAGWKGAVVPDTIWGLGISYACRIHDISYFKGLTIEDKDHADSDFLHNMLEIIDQESSNFIIKALRSPRAHLYYAVVKVAGESAFLEGKDGVNE